MAIKRVRPKSDYYENIYRGTSLTIPVHIKDPDDNPIDLTGYRIAFTIKKVQYDFNMTDDRAYVQKNFEPQEPTDGRFYVPLTSQDTDFEPGQFYFDLEVYHPINGAVFRIVNLEFTLVGGPTNRTINPGVGQLPVGDAITVITIGKGKPIVVITPILTTSGVNAQIAGLYSAIADIQNAMAIIADKIDDLDARLTAAGW
jgi:hypothetical protein